LRERDHSAGLGTLLPSLEGARRSTVLVTCHDCSTARALSGQEVRSCRILRPRFSSSEKISVILLAHERAHKTASPLRLPPRRPVHEAWLVDFELHERENGSPGRLHANQGSLPALHGHSFAACCAYPDRRACSTATAARRSPSHRSSRSRSLQLALQSIKEVSRSWIGRTDDRVTAD
jgi:hypothetical protein